MTRRIAAISPAVAMSVGAGLAGSVGLADSSGAGRSSDRVLADPGCCKGG